MRILFKIILLILVTSCTKSIFSDGGVTITIDFVAYKDDTFQLFYNDSYFKNYSEKNSIKENISGQPAIQQIMFKLPEYYSVKRFRLDLGNNRSQNCIIIKNITVSSPAGSVKYDQSSLTKFFLFNDGTYFKNGNIYLPKDAKNYDPYLISKNLNVVYKSLSN